MLDRTQQGTFIIEILSVDKSGKKKGQEPDPFDVSKGPPANRRAESEEERIKREKQETENYNPSSLRCEPRIRVQNVSPPALLHRKGFSSRLRTRNADGSEKLRNGVEQKRHSSSFDVGLLSPMRRCIHTATSRYSLSCTCNHDHR